MTPDGRQIPDGPAQTRFIYLAPRDILIARVARKCLMRLCESLSQLGVDVELISMGVATVDTEPTRTRSFWDVYGIKQRFRVTIVPTPLRQKMMEHGSSRLLVQFIRICVYPIYALRAYARSSTGQERARRTVFYTRNYSCALGVLPLRRLLRNKALLVLEIHEPPKKPIQRSLLRRVDGVACQSKSLQAEMIRVGILSEANSIGRHGGCELEADGKAALTRELAREKLGWEPNDRIACYTGKVYRGHAEIELLLAAAAEVQQDGIRVVIVGGRHDHVNLWKGDVSARGFNNVDFVPFVAPTEVPLYQVAANALLLYYEPGHPLNDYRSPGKLFEYMASGTPAIVADYLSINEVIRDGENGLIVPPGRPDLLAEAMRTLLNDKALADRLASQARIDVMSYTWTATAEATLSLVDRLWNHGT